MLVLKRLRRKKKISQTDFARAIGVSLRTIQLYEKKDANIPIKNLTKIAKYFDVSIAELYSQEGVNETTGEYFNRNTQFKKGHAISKLDPGKYLVTVPLVMASQYRKYMSAYEDETFIYELPRIGFVIDKVSVGRYLAFEVANSSMDNGTLKSIPDKAVVLGKLTSKGKLSEVLKNNPHISWIIVFKDVIMCKKIRAFNKKPRTITCHSLNRSPEYSDFEIKIDEVEQLFVILKKQVS